MPDILTLAIWISGGCMAAFLVYAFMLRRRRLRLDDADARSPSAQQAKHYYVVGMLCMVVFGPMCLLSLYLLGSDEEMVITLWVGTMALFLFFYLTGVWYVLNSSRRRVEVGEVLRYTPLVGPTKTYRWDEIAYAQQVPSMAKGYDVNHVRLFRVDVRVLGHSRLSSALLKLGVPAKCPEPAGAVLKKRLLAVLGQGQSRAAADQNPLFARVSPNKKQDYDFEANAKPAFGDAEVKIFLPGQTVPLYEMIRASVDKNGWLDDDFTLPHSRPGDAIFVPGGYDGIQLYHTPPMDEEEQARLGDELMDLVAAACTTGDSGALVGFLHAHPFVKLADPLINRLRGGWRGAPPGQRFFSARHWVETSGDTELVKLGIALLNGVNIERDEECRQMLATLALCDEFTLYAQVACSLWDDVNDTIFEFAQRTHGWGKIFMVSRLEPLDGEIADWMARHGCENRISNVYLGHVCASKLNLSYFLETAPMDRELLLGLGAILRACVAKDGPLVQPGVAVMGDKAPAIMLGWLGHAKAYNDDFHTLCTVLAIQGWNAGEEAPNADIAAACAALVAGRDWHAMAVAAIEAEAGQPGKHTAEVFLAWHAAEVMGFSVYEPLFALLESDPVAQCRFAPLFFKEGDWGMRVIELYESALPLHAIATGMGDKRGNGPGYEAHRCLNLMLQGLAVLPLTGTALVEAGLGSPVVANRAMALAVLEGWNTQLDQALWQISPELMGAVQAVGEREVVPELARRCAALLDA